ncbi:hypothetical protein ACP275_12G067600 [Erythranthe tilingii]
MTPESAFQPSKSLTGLHGVHLVSHSSFSFQDIKQNHDSNESSSGTGIVNIGISKRPIVQKVWHQRPACLRPIHCCHTGDKNFAETVVNVLTSLPFIALGLHAPRKNLNCRIYANSLIGVGVASSFYHASRGKMRKYLRWADYTMIATTTVQCLSRAIRSENPKLLMAASVFFLPIQPLVVSAVHTGMMEVAFAKRALQDPDLRTAHNVHKVSSLLGGALFIADDLLPHIPFLHAGWHLAAALGVSTCNKLLQ